MNARSITLQLPETNLPYSVVVIDNKTGQPVNDGQKMVCSGEYFFGFVVASNSSYHSAAVMGGGNISNRGFYELAKIIPEAFFERACRSVKHHAGRLTILTALRESVYRLSVQPENQDTEDES